MAVMSFTFTFCNFIIAPHTPFTEKKFRNETMFQSKIIQYQAWANVVTCQTVIIKLLFVK